MIGFIKDSFRNKYQRPDIKTQIAQIFSQILLIISCKICAKN